MVGMKQRKRLIEKFTTLSKTANKNGVTLEDLKGVLLTHSDNGKCAEINGNVTKTNGKVDEGNGKQSWVAVLKQHIFTIVFIIGVLCSSLVYYYRAELDDYFEIRRTRCAIENNQITLEMARPLVKCKMCLDIDSVPIEYNISAEDFMRKYAYTSVPVLIKEATSNWSAMSTFSFHFFKELYLNTEGAMATQNNECQFFPYKTNFDTLEDVFNMSDKRANFSEGEKPWYIGWSNCHNDVKNELRHHYQRPYFLPADSESSTLDWIFMGGSGPGALVHLDYVQRPSWQAQISGKKTWTLIPPPECDSQCKSLNVTVHKGDIFVVDTNVWYHSTFIHPGEISITIGSEYD